MPPNPCSRLSSTPAPRFPVFLFILIVCACTVSKHPKETTESLVEKEAPIFDKRFQEITFDQLNLTNFWVEKTNIHGARKPVPLHSESFARLTDRVKAGVVNIYTLRLEERDVKFGIAPNDLLPIKIPFLSTLFEVVPFQVPIPFNTEGLSLGSGFIINQEGYILTNAHVILNALDIRIVLAESQRQYPATIIGIDRLTDSALIKIEPDHPLTVLPLGDSDRLRMGEMVLAIGNPLGLTHTVTSGLISAKERVSPLSNDKYADFIQTDSAINPGSSGGPLLNFHGEVVGINTAIVSEAQLIGFAVPVNTVKEVMPMLVLGQPERGWLGIKATALTEEEAAEQNTAGGAALRIREVEAGSPAEQSGLKAGDILLKLNRQSITNFVVFRRKLLGLTPGKKIQLTVLRDGRRLDITSTLTQRQSGDASGS